MTGAINARAFFDPREPEPLTVPPDRPHAQGRPPDPAGARAEPAPAAQSGEPDRKEKPPAQGKYVVASAPPVAHDSPAPDLQAPISISPPETIAPADEGAAAEPGDASAERETPQSGPETAELETAEPDMSTPTLDDDVSPTIRTARIYFGIEPMGGMSGTLQPWEPGQQPIFEDRSAPDAHATAASRARGAAPRSKQRPQPEAARPSPERAK